MTRLNDEGSYTFQADEVNIDYLHSEEFLGRSRALRGSILMAGALLGRFGYAIFPKPGGDKIGRRRLDTHLIGFQELGASCVYDSDKKSYILEAKKLQGKYMLLDEASVTGTANILMAAALAEGTTTIYTQHVSLTSSSSPSSWCAWGHRSKVSAPTASPSRA